MEPTASTERGTADAAGLRDVVRAPTSEIVSPVGARSTHVG